MKVLSHLIRSTTLSIFLCVHDYYVVVVNWMVRRRKAVHEFRSRMKKKRWLWCFHWREVWCCIISSWTKSTCSPKTGITRIRGPLKTTAPFKSEHIVQARISKPTSISPMGKSLGSNMVGWKYPIHLDTPTVIGWTKCQEGHSSEYNSGLRWLKLRVPMGSGLRPCV